LAAFSKQIGGHGQFADCWIKMMPLERGANFEFSNEISVGRFKNPGRASCTMEFDYYDFVPQLQAEKIIAAATAATASHRPR
jgi:translation elongation factor EF-G